MRTSKSYLRFGVCHGRGVYISGALGGTLGERVDFYQNKTQGVYALVTAQEGDFKVAARDSTGAKNIASQHLCDFFARQGGAGEQQTMPAWPDAANRAILFSARPQVDAVLDDGFQKVDFGPVSTCQTVFTEEGDLAAGWYSPSACTAYEKGRTLALVPTKRGRISRVRRPTGGYQYDSKELAQRCRELWKQGRVYRRQLGGTVLLSSSLPELLDTTDMGDFQPVPLAPVQPYIRMCRDRRIWFSPEAIGLLGKRINVYISRDYLAFCRAPKGEIALTVEDNSATVFLMQLYHMIVTYYAGAEYLSLAPREAGEALMVLCPQGKEEGPFPVRQSFCRLLLQEGHSCTAWRQAVARN